MKRSKAGAKTAIRAESETKPEDATSMASALERTVFVGNVPVGMHRRKLEALFRPYGTVESSRFRSIAPAKPNLSPKAALLKGLWHPARCTCNAFVVFKDSASVEQALALNGTRVDTDDGRQVHIRVDRCSSASRRIRERSHNPCGQGSAVETDASMRAPEGVREEPLRAQWDHRRSIFLGNVPFDANEEEIRNLFSDCGPITNVRIVRDSQTSMGKGFAYVTFTPEANMDLALGRHEVVQLRGRYLRVQRSSARLANRRMQGQVTIQPDCSARTWALKPEKARRYLSSCLRLKAQVGIN
ncbi:hypothetical protein F1559_000493 [Cyanidiococcus yangmingshanensis]|uniref:RRM domain-containing protein n=1 Tax=Cyanidiococcus yangmingshanensis TaxID=2690220 RepID=A0A7J7ILN4_9RHOD|nr:hypothetical protein F1559_000493 [Cyanidiococcus yangmingshanensis]